jgi:hypothetical protein
MFRIGTNTLQFLILFSKLTTDHGHLGDEGGDQVTDEMGRVQLGHPIRDFKPNGRFCSFTRPTSPSSELRNSLLWQSSKTGSPRWARNSSR